MSDLSILAGATSQSINVDLYVLATGAAQTGLVFNSSGLTAYYSFTGANATSTQISLVTLATVTTAYSSGGFIAIDGTNMPGLYRLDLPNAALATSKGREVIITLTGFSGMATRHIKIELTAVDNQSTGFGLVNASANVVQISGSNVSATTAQLGVNVVNWNNTVVATPATAGIPDINVKNMNNVAATSITTINANQGTTQPINFTGTAGSALVKSDMTDIAGSAVSTSTAQIGVNLVNISGSAVSTSTAQLGINLVNWNGTAATSTIPPDAIFIRSGTAQAGGATSITLDAGASATNNLYNNETIFIRSGTGAGQSNIITGYVGSTKVATVNNTWATNPDSTSVFSILSIGPFNANTVQSTNVVQWNGTNVSSPATAGIPDVNVKNMNNVAATSITTINANQGTTQPVNFSGTGSSAFIKSDTEQLNAQAVSTSGTVTFPNATIASTTNITAGTITNATNVTNLTNAPTVGDFTSTMKTSLNNSTPASITGAVGSVTGNVGGNVTGSVGSVVAAVAITSNRKKGSSDTVLFAMYNSTTGGEQTGLTVTSNISKDTGSFASTSNSVVEIANGWYYITLTSTEMNANNIALQMSATGAITRDIYLQTQP
jgi:hypothetical protein